MDKAQQLQHKFSIDKAINPADGRPFGSRFAGEFVIRRPSLADRTVIALKEAAGLCAYGPVNVRSLPPEVTDMSFIFAHVNVLAEKRPDWCDPTRLFDGEESAVYAVWEQIDGFLEQFRAAKAGPPRADERAADSPPANP